MARHCNLCSEKYLMLLQKVTAPGFKVSNIDWKEGSETGGHHPVPPFVGGSLQCPVTEYVVGLKYQMHNTSRVITSFTCLEPNRGLAEGDD
jgi:hypothetical protein